jgi:hypothetical protein
MALGVTKYAGECQVCAADRPTREKVEGALYAGAYALDIARHFRELCVRDVRQHEQCMREEDLAKAG